MLTLKQNKEVTLGKKNAVILEVGTCIKSQC